MQDSVYDDSGWQDLHPDKPIVAISFDEALAQVVECLIGGAEGVARAYMRIAESRFRTANFRSIQSAISSGTWPKPGHSRADDDPTFADRTLRSLHREDKGGGE